MQSSPILGNEVAHFLTFLIALEKPQWRRGVNDLRLLPWPSIRKRNPPRTIVQGDWSLACALWPRSSDWKAVSFRLYASRFEKLQRRRRVIRLGHTVSIGIGRISRVPLAGRGSRGRVPSSGKTERVSRARLVNRPRRPLSRSRARSSPYPHELAHAHALAARDPPSAGRPEEIRLMPMPFRDRPRVGEKGDRNA